MSSEEVKERSFGIMFKSGKEHCIHAATVDGPNGQEPFYIFKDCNGIAVAQYDEESVIGWRVEDI